MPFARLISLITLAVGELAPDLDRLMERVDEVWDRFAFRTPWSRVREHDRVRAALDRFLQWHAANPRTLLGTEESFAATVDLDGGERVRLTGYADRLELAGDGSVVVVDLKTSRTAPSGPQVQRHVQLALYQYAVDGGAVDGLLPGGDAHGRTGGAELVQLGLTDGGPAALVQPQERQTEQSSEREALRSQLEQTAALLRAENFPAVSGQHCRDCSFVPLCPIKGAGSVTSQ